MGNKIKLPHCPYLEIEDTFCSISEAARVLDISRVRVKKLLQERKILWDQPKDSAVQIVEIGSLLRLKYPDKQPNFGSLTVSDPMVLQKEIDNARFSIAMAAGLPPCAVIISFDMLGKKRKTLYLTLDTSATLRLL